MKKNLLFLIVLLGMIAILGCVSGKINTPQNNTTVDTPGHFPNATATKISIDAGNYIDSYGLTAIEKLDAIKVAIDAEQFRQHSRGSTNISIGDVLPSNASEKPMLFDSGYLNTSDRIVAVSIYTTGNVISGIPYFPVSFVVYVDISNWTVVGVDTYDSRATYCFTVTDLPENSTWYHQLAGATRRSQDYNTTRMELSVITSDNDSDSIYPLILDAENFKKFRNGSRYEALQYKDYTTNKTCLIDGKTHLLPRYAGNATAVWEAYISTSDRSPGEDAYYKRTDYYIVLRNNANRTIPITLNIPDANFFPRSQDTL